MRVVLFVFLTGYCLAQSNTATVSGAIYDARGEPIGGAEVVSVQEATGVRTGVCTNESGVYAIPGLNVGRYSLTVEKPGFRRQAQSRDHAERKTTDADQWFLP